MAGVVVRRGEGADAGVEFPVAGAEFDFVAFLEVGGGCEAVYGCDVVEASGVLRTHEAAVFA